MRILSLQVSEKAKDETVPLLDCTSKTCVDSGGMKRVASVLGANRLSVRVVDTDSDGCSDVSGDPTLGFCMTGRPPGGQLVLHGAQKLLRLTREFIVLSLVVDQQLSSTSDTIG